MTITLIAAMANNRIIGQNNQLPWHLPEDLQYFKEQTLGKPIIMGRKTFESIGKPLPKRTNYVITRNPDFSAKGVTVCNSLDEALAQTKEAAETMIIGGASIYELALPLADKMLLTYIDADFPGDQQFPQWDSDQWQIESRETTPKGKHPFSYSYLVLTRIAK